MVFTKRILKIKLSFVSYTIQFIWSLFILLLISHDRLLYSPSSFEKVFSIHMLFLIFSGISLYLILKATKIDSADLKKSIEKLAIYPILMLLFTLLVITNILPSYYNQIRDSFLALLILNQSISIWNIYVDIRTV